MNFRLGAVYIGRGLSIPAVLPVRRAGIGCREGRAITRIYEHTKTGEVFIIPDPQLRMEQIAEVRQQVTGLPG